MPAPPHQAYAPFPPHDFTPPQHIRQVHYRSFERADGLWDIEGELLDTKAIDLPRPNGSGVRKAGDPIHHMRIRVTVDTRLVVQAIEASLEAHPVQGCPGALAGMQRMVGCSMARGWRKAIDTHLAGIAGCTHLRELLNNMATAAFQSIVSAFSTTPDQPPAYLGRCTGWDFHGPAVLQYYPQFAGWRLPEGKGPALPPATAVTNPTTPHG
ncbi:DUF2889 domain-containing protein [Comamonas aquatica]|uniref:DUF2889 domain-containing protein n=1 Tax=Comamonas aquatica TaxID=225991 RepID=UPI001EF1CF79|nr:DUF2889 domain-containing protein [Comamonas aquatica]